MNLEYEAYGNCYLCAIYVQDIRIQKNDEFCDIIYVPQFEKLNYDDSMYIKEDYLKIIKTEKVCVLPSPTYCNGDYAEEQKEKHRKEHKINKNNSRNK